MAKEKSFFANYHAHVPMMFWVGKGAEKDKDWVETWWNPFIGPIESKLARADMKVLAEACALAYLDNNISEVWDMYFFEEEIANTLAKHGIRVFAGEAIMTDPPTGFKKLEAVRETERLLNKFKANDLIVPVVGYIGPYDWASDKEMTEKSAELAIKFKARVHTHGAGNLGDFEDCKKVYGMTPIETLECYGFFSEEIPEIVIAHCAVLDKKEIEILKKHGEKVKIAVCPRASLKLNYPKAPVKELIKNGITVVLGTDGGSPSGIPSIREEIKVASEFYGVPASYFEKANYSGFELREVNERERIEIIGKWRECLNGLAERAGLDGKAKSEFLESKKLLS